VGPRTVARGMERAALIPAFSRREKEKVLRGCRRVRRVLAGTNRDGSRGRGVGVLRRAGRDTLSPRERAGVREPVSTLAMAGMGRFRGRSVSEMWTRRGTMNRGARDGAGGPHPGLLPEGEGEVAPRVSEGEPGVGWNESRRLARKRRGGVATGRTRHPLPPGEGRGEGAGFNPRDGWHGTVPGQECFQDADMPGDHEAWREGWSGRPSSRPSPGGRRRRCSAGVGG
jgi:hypothetical protein